MTRPITSLIDVLSPPENPWLKGLAKRKLGLPAGVRVVRFSEEEDEFGAAAIPAPPTEARRGHAGERRA